MLSGADLWQILHGSFSFRQLLFLSSAIDAQCLPNNIRQRLNVENITERCRKARLRWIGQVNRRDQEYFEGQTLEMVPRERRIRGRPKQRWTHCVNQDMRDIGTTEDEVHDRTGWRRELCLPQRPHNQVGAARRRRRLPISLSSRYVLTLFPSHVCSAFPTILFFNPLC